jgi:hypothetical protein
LALKKALEKATHQYHVERCRLENERLLADKANFTTQDIGKYVTN